MSKILPFTGVTKLPVPVDKVLDNTPRDLQSVIILGYDSNDEFYFSSSIPEGPEILWLLEQAKTELLRICEDKDNG